MSPKSCIQMFFFSKISGEGRAEGCDSNQYRKPHWQDNDRLKDNDIQLLCFKTDSVVFLFNLFFNKKINDRQPMHK